MVRTKGAKVAVRDGDDLRRVPFDDLPAGTEILGLVTENDEGAEGVFFISVHHRLTKPIMSDAIGRDGKAAPGHIFVGPMAWPEYMEAREHRTRFPYCIPLRVEATEDWEDEGLDLLTKAGETGKLRVAYNTLPRHLTNIAEADMGRG